MINQAENCSILVPTSDHSNLLLCKMSLLIIRKSYTANTLDLKYINIYVFLAVNLTSLSYKNNISLYKVHEVHHAKLSFIIKQQMFSFIRIAFRNANPFRKSLLRSAKLFPKIFIERQWQTHKKLHVFPSGRWYY